MIAMKYTVRVKHSSTKREPQFEEFENDSRDDEALSDLHNEAVDAYLAAVQEHDSGHTVSLFRSNDDNTGAVAVHEALGTGSAQLATVDSE